MADVAENKDIELEKCRCLARIRGIWYGPGLDAHVESSVKN